MDGGSSQYDGRNKLNDLSGAEWLKLTKSYWVSKRCKEDKDAMNHPAPFLLHDTMTLISLFTKAGMRVLDPFVGSGTTLIASMRLGRYGIGIDINEQFKVMALERMGKIGYLSADLFAKDQNTKRFEYLLGDSNEVIQKIDPVDYIVTSPPYHNILRNNGAGIRDEKKRKVDDKNKQYVLQISEYDESNPFITEEISKHRKGARDGVEYYTEFENDLGNMVTYNNYLDSLGNIMQKCYDVLNKGKYCSIVISDFTVDKKEMCVQGDIVKMMQKIGFEFSGTILLLQESKPLYPFGYPFAYKINHHHQNIINFRKVQ